MFPLLRRLTYRFCESYTQKNHRADFTVNRINQKFIHLHLDYLQMNPKNYDQRLVINIFVKSAEKNDPISSRILNYILSNIHRISNLTSIVNVLRQKEWIESLNISLLPLYKTGLSIMEQNKQEDGTNTNKLFKNYEPIHITNFFRSLMQSKYKYLLSQAETRKVFKLAIQFLGPWHTVDLIKNCIQIGGLEEEIDLLCDHLEVILPIINTFQYKEMGMILRGYNNKKLRDVYRSWRGTKHEEEYNSYS